jgi:RNA polymerase sigma-70 factor, ECF subfamily
MQDRVAYLIRQVAADDRAAFRELYRATSDVLFGVLIRMLRNRASAEDGLQEVFARVWLRAGSFVETRGSGMTWLMTIARNYAIANWWRWSSWRLNKSSIPAAVRMTIWWRKPR